MHALVVLISAIAVVTGSGRCTPGEQRALTTGPTAWVAVAVHRTTVFRSPAGGALTRFGRLNENSAPTVFSPVGERVDWRCRPTWLRVELPMRPNGAIGWVHAGDVALTRVRTRIFVDLAARRVRLYRDGRLVLSSSAAVGASATPTPTGRFYVNQRLLVSDATGPYGPGAVGISAFSNVLTSWAQGGPIAIHGTNEPWSIGRAASHGCIRLPNRVLLRLFAQTPLGTPVIIKQ